MWSGHWWCWQECFSWKSCLLLEICSRWINCSLIMIRDLCFSVHFGLKMFVEGYFGGNTWSSHKNLGFLKCIWLLRMWSCLHAQTFCMCWSWNWCASPVQGFFVLNSNSGCQLWWAQCKISLLWKWRLLLHRYSRSSMLNILAIFLIFFFLTHLMTEFILCKILEWSCNYFLRLNNRFVYTDYGQ